MTNNNNNNNNNNDNGMLSAVKDTYAGLAVGIRHLYWGIKIPIQKITSTIIGSSDSNSSSSTNRNGKGNGVNASANGLKVVGVGFGRTGTYSLGLALNQLGYPALHTYHLYENSEIIDMWTENVFKPGIQSKQISKGNPNFEVLTSNGYTAAVDFPMALYFEELRDIYPDCKFILTVRENSEIWFRSWNSMAIKISRSTNFSSSMFKHVNQLALYLRWLFANIHKDERILSIPPGQPLPHPDKTNAILSYEEHNKRVQEVIPSDRLLQYNVKEGWEPLCNFLNIHDKDCPIDTPFPKTNTAASLIAQNIVVVVFPLSIILFVLFTAFAFGFQGLTGKKVLPWLDSKWKRFRWSMRNSGGNSGMKKKRMQRKQKI